MTRDFAGYVVRCSHTERFLNPRTGRLDAEVDWIKHLFRDERTAQHNAHAYTSDGNLEVVPVRVTVTVPE